MGQKQVQVNGFGGGGGGCVGGWGGEKSRGRKKAKERPQKKKGQKDFKKGYNHDQDVGIKKNVLMGKGTDKRDLRTPKGSLPVGTKTKHFFEGGFGEDTRSQQRGSS